MQRETEKKIGMQDAEVVSNETIRLCEGLYRRSRGIFSEVGRERRSKAGCSHMSLGFGAVLGRKQHQEIERTKRI